MDKRRLELTRILVGKGLSKNHFCQVLGCLFIFLPSISFAACPGSPPTGIECVEVATAEDITANAVCWKVTNNHASNKSLMVPIKTSTEWTGFYTHPPAGVTISACGP